MFLKLNPRLHCRCRRVAFCLQLHWLKISSQFRALDTSPLGKKPPVPTEYGARWARFYTAIHCNAGISYNTGYATGIYNII
jgi:hypothetical protein